MKNELHTLIRQIDRIPWPVWAITGIVGTLGTIRLVHKALGNA